MTMKWTVKLILATLLIVLVLQIGLVPVLADDEEDDPTGPSLITGKAGMRVSNVSTDDFPQIRFELEAYDAGGLFITTLFPSSVEIVEEEQSFMANQVTLMEPGLQTIVAVNPGILFLNSYLGYTNWDRLRFALQAWVEAIPPGKPDNFNLIGGETARELNYVSPRAFSNILESYQPNFMTEAPSLYSLATALDVAAEPLENARSKRAILWITPTLNNTLLELLPAFIEQAEAQGVPVHIWLVGTAFAADSQSAFLMKEFAERTNGSFFLYTGLEFLPDIEEYVQPLRYYYQVSYSSLVTEPGTHAFSVNVYYEQLTLKSTQQSFEVQLLPPNPIFLSPPYNIEQTWEIAANAIEARPSPESIALRLLVEFPDGIQRTITSSRLYVDGELYQENTTPPYDRFDWYIGDTTESGTHVLQAEITDGLGFTSETIEIPVTLTVGDKPMTFFGNQRLVTAAALAVAALILVTVITLAGQRRSSLLEQRQLSRAYQDPLTQPVSITQEFTTAAPNQTTETETEPTNDVTAAYMEQIAPAKLVFLSPDSPSESEMMIVLESDELTIGSSRDADFTFKKTSISPQHAIIKRSEQGVFTIFDCDSLTGTWVNYAPVGKHGVQLNQGDLIQLGQEVFRFDPATYAWRQPEPQA
jgi:hypothetical protein